MNVRLKEERNRLKYKQKFISDAIEVHNVTISNYEKGKIAIPATYLAKLAPLGFDVQYILTGIRSNITLNPEEHTLLQFYRNATPTIRQATLAILMSGGFGGGQGVTVNGAVTGGVVAHTINGK